METTRGFSRRFIITFLINTEFFSYFVIIPLLFIYFMVNLDISMENLILLLKILVVVIPVSMSTTFISDMMEVSPIRKYLTKKVSGAGASEEEYERARRRFFSLPFVHAVGSLIRWIFGLVMAYIPFTMLADLTPVQTFNVWTTAVIIPPFGMVLYFFLTERFIQRYLNGGLFNRMAVKDTSRGISFISRMVVSLVVMISIPMVGVIGYFLLQLERANVEWSISYVKFGMILFFGVMIASSIIYCLTGAINVKVAMIIDFMRRMGSGNLSAEKPVMAVADDLSRVSQNVFIMRENIAGIIREIQQISTRLDTSTDSISKITESFSRDTQSQAATVEEVTATMEEISASMDAISGNARSQMRNLQSFIVKMDEFSEAIVIMGDKTSTAQGLTADIASQARRGEDSLGGMKENMGKIGERSHQMTGIIAIINDISDKINLLSLNASIEAARAGDSGRGFAVVADEISKLADTTATSVKEIGSLIKSSEEEIGHGISIVNDVVLRISSIITGVAGINAMVDGISTFIARQVENNVGINQSVGSVRTQSEEIEKSIDEQKIAMNEVVSSINGINELTQKISSGSEEIVENTKKNYEMARELKKKSEFFTMS